MINIMKSLEFHRDTYRLSYKILFAVIICSFILTLFATFFQLYFDYRKDVRLIHTNLNFIKESYLPAINTSVFNFNDDQTRTLLEGALKIQDITYIEIRNTENERYLSTGNPESKRDIIRIIPLEFQFSSNSVFPTGSLNVSASLTDVKKRLLDKAILILFTNIIQTFFAAIFIFIIIQWMSTRHLRTMANYADKINLRELDEPLLLNRVKSSSSQPDELDKVVASINNMRLRLKFDIEAAIQAEKKIKESHERFITVLNSIDAAIYVSDMQTYEILFMNQYLKEASKKDLLGETCWKTLKNELEPCSFCTSNQITDHEGNPSGVNIWESTNPVTGNQYVYHSRAIKWIDGHLVRLQVGMDITQIRNLEANRLEMEKQLGHSQKMEAIGTLAGGIAHDFNNILSAIMGYTELALDFIPKENKASDDLAMVLKSCARAKDLVKQILSFSRQSEHEKKPIRIHFVVREALKLLRASIPSTIEIQELGIRNMGNVFADETKIHQIIMNLCTNAYQAMKKEGGRLKVELTHKELDKDDLSRLEFELDPGNYIIISVSDTGKGIHPTDLNRVFEPYYTTKVKDEGTGLGLAVVHGIVKNHNGHISVYSELGNGTEFKVYLPLIQTEEIETTSIKKQTDPSGHEHILIVDDESTVLDIEKRLLESLGYQVDAVSDATEALTLFQEKTRVYDLVITDMTMPHMTGAELSIELLKIKPDLPIIICTGFSGHINEKRAKAIGVCNFLTKPVMKKDLAQVVRKALDKS